MQIAKLVVPVSFALFYSDLAGADSSDPFYTRNQNPYIQIFSLSQPRPDSRPAAGQWAHRLIFHGTSNARTETAGNETLTLAGESYRLEFNWQYGWSDSFSLGLDVPLLYHGDALFDSAIVKWHQLWGLSNTERDKVDSRDLNYSFAGEQTHQLTTPGGHIGDVNLYGVWPFEPPWGGNSRYTLTGTLKLPTGNAEDLAGSGSYDVSLLLQIKDIPWPSDSLSSHMGLGYTRLGRAERFLPEHRSDVYTLTAGTGYVINERWRALLQLDFHTAVYEVDVAALGDSSTQLTVGGSYRTDSGKVLDFGLTENLYTDATPDVVFYFSVSR